jgi:hypothetical protein
MIAYTHDTSAAEIERTYARYLHSVSEDMRAGLLADIESPASDNVISLPR